MILLIDNHDSFTYNLFQYIRMLGRETRVARNDEIAVDEALSLHPELIVISPGPGGPQDSGVCLELLAALPETVPVLGVCLGMQTIAHHFGAEVVRARVPVHGKVRPVRHDGSGLFANLPNPLQVTRYHSLVVDPATLPSCLEATAWSDEGEVMGLRHRVFPISGVQFHPEAYLTEGGMRLLGNALEAVAC